MVTRFIIVAGLLATVSLAQASPVVTAGAPVVAGWTLTSGSVNVLAAVDYAELMLGQGPSGQGVWDLHTQLGGSSGASALLYAPTVQASYAQIVSSLGFVLPAAQLPAGVPLNVITRGGAGSVETGSGGQAGAGGPGAGGLAGAGGGVVGGAGALNSAAGAGNNGAGNNAAGGGAFAGVGAGTGSGAGSGGVAGAGGSGATVVTTERGGSNGGGSAGNGSDLNVLPSTVIAQLSSTEPVQQLVNLELLDVQEIPEPDTDILFIAGLCAAGLLLRRLK